MLKIALYEIKKFIRNKRWLVIFLAQPIILVILLGMVASHNPEHIKVSIYNLSLNQKSQQIIDKIEQDGRLDLVYESSMDRVEKNIRDDKAKIGLIINVSNQTTANNIKIIENVTSPEISGKAKEIVTRLVWQISEDNLSGKEIPIELIPVKVINGRNTIIDPRYFDLYASAFIVLLVIIISLNTSSSSITQERVDGTFERFFVTPYTKAQMIIGKMLAFVLIAIVLSLIIIFSLNTFFAVTLGPIWLVFLITFVTSLSAVSMGLLISCLTYTVAESIQVSILVFFPCLILTGMIFQTEVMSPIIKIVHDLVPFTYAITAMREVNLLGFSFQAVAEDLLILFASTLLFLILAIVFLRRKKN